MDADYLWMMILPWVQNEYKKRGLHCTEAPMKSTVNYIYIIYITHLPRNA